jgi:flagellar hook-length control protein FliK
LSNGQNKEVDDAPRGLLSQLRQLLSNGQIKEVDEVSKELLAQLRQLLSSGQFADVDSDGEQADMLAQLRRLLTQGPMGDAGGAESRRQVFDLLSQAFSERSGDVSGADSLALLKASLTANTRGSEQTNAAAEGAKAFDLARLLTPDGARQFADRLAMIAQARAGMAELKLHPPSLGSMEVRVSMDADRAHVHFVSANPAVRDLLEAALPRLREALAQDGISLGDASVSDQPPQRRDEASGEGAAAGDGEGGGDTDGEALLAAEGPVASSTLSALARKLDLFA